MALWQGKSKRKRTGGRYRPIRKKRAFEIAPEAQFTTIWQESTMKGYRTRGDNKKMRLMTAIKANVFDPKSGKVKNAKLLTVKSNSANPNYVQRNIITKGAIVQTDLGTVRITSRPGQDGVVNAVLVE